MEDEIENISRNKRTEMELNKIMNSINPDLKFTTEIETDFKTGRLPTLSFEIWSELGGIRHSYFEKEMRAQILTCKESSMSEQSKYSILVNELMRRFEVMDDKIGLEEKTEKIDHFTKQLKNSGYSFEEAREIVQSCLKGVIKK